MYDIEAQLIKHGDGYSLVLKDKNNITKWLNITEEEAEVIQESLDIEMEEVPF